MIKLIENNTPNVSLEVFYDEAKNCTEVRLNAWHPLKEDEVKAIKEFIRNRKETPRKTYPLGGWVEEDRETFCKLKPLTFGVDYATPGKDRTAWAVAGELSEEAKAAFREAVGKNFDRQYNGDPVPREFKVGPLVHGWELGHAAEDEAARLIDMDTLLHRFAFRNHDKIKGRLSMMAAAEVLEFAKLVRVLTIQETTEGISARLKKTRWENDITPVPWVDRRPDENLILLPKDFTI